MSSLRPLLKYTSTDTRVVDAMRMAENYVKAHTEGGKVRDLQVYNNAIDGYLAPYSDDLRVMGKIESFRNEVEKLEVQAEKLENNTITFKSEYSDNLADFWSSDFSEPGTLFGDLEDFYAGKYAEYDRKILQAYLAEGKMPPQTAIDFGNEMADQFSLYRDFGNAFRGGKIENPQGYAVYMKTNPQTGEVISTSIEVIDSIKIEKQGYTSTDSSYGGIPIYANSFREKGVRTTRIGDITYTYDEGEKRLRQSAEGAWEGIKKLARKVAPGLDFREIDYSRVAFNNQSVPDGAIVKDSEGNFYWFDKNKDLWKADNIAEAKDVLSANGRDRNETETNFYPVNSLFINSRYTPDKGGQERKASTLLGVSPEGQETLRLPSVSPQPSTGGNFDMNRFGPSSSALPPLKDLGAPMSRREKVRETPEFFGGKYSASQVSKKGEEITKKPYAEL